MQQLDQNDIDKQSDSASSEAIANHLAMKKRESAFLRFGYDSPASIAYMLSKILPLTGKILEIGSGKGRFLTALAKNVPFVTSVDIDAQVQHHAFLTASYAGLSSRIRFVTQNAQQLGWPSGLFDAVVTMNAMHHFPQPDRALAEMVRVLKPGGKLAICDFSPSGFLVMDRIHQAEGTTHQHPNRRFPHWQAWLRKSGFRTRTWCDFHQELLVGQKPGSVSFNVSTHI